MAKYKQTEKEQWLFLIVSILDQLVDGAFEHTLDRLIDTMDMSIFNARYANDLTGAPAVNPAVLLKIILYCYSIGIISFRKIAALCQNHIIVKVLSGNTESHFTTISNFVSAMGAEAEWVRDFLSTHEERKGAGGETIKSNITDKTINCNRRG
ncbi:MAG: transposase [Spirochaetaceae bacterium]|jgi:transposase|nr:transposase [Spirochaetaceae bacterium]